MSGCVPIFQQHLKDISYREDFKEALKQKYDVVISPSKFVLYYN